MKILIVDDEYPARKLIRYYIEDENDIEIVGEYDNCREALDYINMNSVDIVFLDINMPKMNGIDMAEKIKNMLLDPLIRPFSKDSIFVVSDKICNLDQQ